MVAWPAQLRPLSLGSLQWVVGTFIAVLGALMLVSPHQFASATYAPLSPHLAWFGPGFLLAGAGLFAVATFAPAFRFVLLAHLLAGGMLLIMSGSVALSSSWTGTFNYGVLGLGLAVAPLLAYARPVRSGQAHGDYFSFVIGVATTLTGLLLLTMPTQFTASLYDLVRPNLPWYGIAFIVGGVIVCLSQVGLLVPAPLGRWSPLLVAACLFLFGFAVALPNRAWPGVAYYGGFGSALVLLAALGPYVRRLDSGSLRTRLALVLAAAAAVPILILTPVYSHEEESHAVVEQLTRQEALASALAQNVSDYGALHEAALRLRVTQPGLSGLSSNQQQLLLTSSRAASAAFVARNNFADERNYLIDANAQIIVPPDPAVPGSPDDPASNPDLMALVTNNAEHGSGRVLGSRGEMLTSYARVPDLGWSVVVERSSAAALAPTRAKLDLLFGGLMLVIAAAAAFGVVAAGWLSQPLITLGAAVDGLAAGDANAPLPAGGLTEIAGLAVAFGAMRARVVTHTAALVAANAELEAFSYSVSHDLRAPLRAINGFARILLEEHAEALEPEAQSYLGLVRDNARQMGVLIDDLLSFSRLSRQGLHKDRVLPADLVRDVLGDLAPELAGRQVEVVIGDLLPCQADTALLKQVFVNLLSNALKFTRQRAIGHVEVGCRQIDGEVVYFVTDNGAGFDMRYGHKLFGVFQRLHRAEDYEGTGVGLAIVQRIAQRHGGRVWAAGAVDHGATFSFTLASAQVDGPRRAPYQREEEGADDIYGLATRDAA